MISVRNWSQFLWSGGYEEMIKNSMKKFVILLLMVILLLQGCADKDAETKAVTGSTVETAEEEHSEGN